jgi:hypothetical protein
MSMRCAWVGRLARFAMSMFYCGLILIEPRVACADGLAPATAQASIGQRLPEGFSLARVLDDARLSKQQAEVYEVSALLGPQAAIDRVAHFWRLSPQALVLEQRSGAWLLLSRLSAGQLEILQLQAGSTLATGFLTVWRSSTHRTSAALERLLPAGFRPGPQLQVREGARLLTSAVIQAEEPLASSARRLASHLEQRGFRPSMEQVVGESSGAGLYPVARYRQGIQELRLVSGGDGVRSHFVMTLSEPHP